MPKYLGDVEERPQLHPHLDRCTALLETSHFTLNDWLERTPNFTTLSFRSARFSNDGAKNPFDVSCYTPHVRDLRLHGWRNAVHFAWNNITSLRLADVNAQAEPSLRVLSFCTSLETLEISSFMNDRRAIPSHCGSLMLPNLKAFSLTLQETVPVSQLLMYLYAPELLSVIQRRLALRRKYGYGHPRTSLLPGTTFINPYHIIDDKFHAR